MNERIQEIVAKADWWKPNGLPSDWDEDDYIVSPEQLNRFSELIAQECIDILMKSEHAMNHPEELSEYNRGWVNGRLLGIEHIKHRFGVK